MKKQLILTFLLTGTFVAPALISTIAQSKAESPVKFICNQSFDQEKNNNLPTTFAWHSKGKTALIRWETKYFRNYSPQRRCEEVSPRFQQAYENGSLNLITNGRMNNQPVICTARKYGAACDTLLMTLRPEDNSLQVLNVFKEILDGRQKGPVKHSSGTPQIYYQINIDEFLRNAPVEKK
jgi:Circadian oscillating protein COP23